MWIKKTHKTFLRSQKVDLVCLQEAKMDSVVGVKLGLEL